MPSSQTPQGRAPDGRRGPGGGAPGTDGRGHGVGGAAPARPTTKRRWIAPLATFVLGLLLGAVVTVPGADQDARPAPTTTQPAAPSTTGPGPAPGVAAAVPGACLEVADRAEQLAGLVRDAAVAAGQLDAAELSAIVRRMEESQAGLETLSSTCRGAGAAAP